jgi:hypothetical protein
MAIDGFYGIVYCGHTGMGIAAFSVSNGRLEGWDWDRVRYTGTAVETPGGNILVDLCQEVPSGVELVTGLVPQDAPYRLEIKEELPPLFGDGQPVKVQRGTVTVMVKRIRDDYVTSPTSLWSRLTPRL